MRIAPVDPELRDEPGNDAKDRRVVVVARLDQLDETLRGVRRGLGVDGDADLTGRGFENDVGYLGYFRRGVFHAGQRYKVMHDGASTSS